MSYDSSHSTLLHLTSQLIGEGGEVGEVTKIEDDEEVRDYAHESLGSGLITATR